MTQLTIVGCQTAELGSKLDISLRTQRSRIDTSSSAWMLRITVVGAGDLTTTIRDSLFNQMKSFDFSVQMAGMAPLA